MMLQQIISRLYVIAFILVSLCRLSTAQSDALRDAQIGMQGLMESTKDPAALAQLLKDMQVNKRRFFVV